MYRNKEIKHTYPGNKITKPNSGYGNEDGIERLVERTASISAREIRFNIYF